MNLVKIKLFLCQQQTINTVGEEGMSWMTVNPYKHIAVHVQKSMRRCQGNMQASGTIYDADNRLIPNSIKLDSTFKGHRAEEILLKTQNKLLSARIKQIHFTVKVSSAHRMIRPATGCQLFYFTLTQKVPDLWKKSSFHSITKAGNIKKIYF